jgi:hypothetical protein
VLLLVLLLLQSPTGDADSGSIWIRTEPDLIVYLDGVKAGVSNPEQRGLWIYAVKAGRHEIRVEVPGGGSATMPVDVQIGTASQVTISSLGIRTSDVRRFGELEVRATYPRSGCAAKLGERRKSLTASGVTFDQVLAGRQRLVVTCGSRTFHQDLQIAAGHSLLVNADLVNGTIQVVEDRSLRPQIVVTSRRPEVLNAPIAAAAKRALIGALEQDIQVLYVSQTLDTVMVQIEAPTANHAGNFIERFKKRPEVDQMAVKSTETRNVRLRVTFTFTVR